MPLPRLETEGYTLDVSATPYVDHGFWRVTNLFRGKTPRLRSVSAHVSWLADGHSAHPAHHHPGEELCVLLEGELDVQLPTEGVRTKVVPGQAAYMSADLPHGLESTGSAPAVYAIARWLSDPPASKVEPLAHAVLDISTAAASSRRLLVDATTDYLEALRCETVSLAPGEEAASVAEADRMLVVLEGRVEVGDAEASAVGCLFALAGERRPVTAGEVGARYLEIELRPYPASPARRVVNAARWYSRRTPLRRSASVLGE